MITVKQIKAARALVDWTQEDLARKSGMSLAAINKLERELVSPRQFTLKTIQQTFEREGVEFTEGPGVRLTADMFRMQVLDGHNAPPRLLDDIFETLRAEPAPSDALLSGLDERLWRDWDKEVYAHQMRCRKLGIRFRALLCEGDTEFLSYVDVKETYRWIPKTLFTQMLYYVYGNKYAMVLWGPPVRIIIIGSKIIAETYRRQFEMNWQNGKMPRTTSTERRPPRDGR